MPAHRVTRDMTPAARRPARRLLAALALALLATACAGGDTAAGDVTEAGATTSRTTAAGDAVDVEVRPFEEIQDSEITVEADPTSPTRGIFRVTTTEEAICAIVWGEDESFGRFNNSLAMSGTGIIQHDVILPDLEQGREYVYVLQGSTADGTLYRSDVMTFTIPVAEAADAAPEPDLGENIATGAAIAEVSSEFNDAFAAANAIDGDLSSEWSSATDGDGAFITLDLGEPTELTGVAFLTRSMADGSAITEEYAVTTDAGEVLGPFPAGNPAQARITELDAPVTATTLRFEVVRSTGGNVGAVEIQVFAG